MRMLPSSIRLELDKILEWNTNGRTGSTMHISTIEIWSTGTRVRVRDTH